MKRILILSSLLGSVAWGQCVVLPPISTANLGLNTVQHNACNWDVQYNQVPTQVDLMLSGYVGIWGINLKPLVLSHNPTTGVTIYFNQTDSLIHVRTSVGGDTVLGGGGGGNVFNSGTPTAPQVAIWVDATHIQGVAALTKSQQFGSTVYVDNANTFGAFLNSFAASSLIIPKSAGAGPTVGGQVAYDTTSNTYQLGNGTGSDAVAYFLGSPPTAGTAVCVGAAAYQITTSGCAAAGGTVTTSGSPASGQYAKFTAAAVITGQVGIPGADLTGSRTVPQTTLPLGTSAAPGILQCDGTSITCSGGIASATGGLTVGGNGTLTITAGVIDTVNGVVGKLTNSETVTGLWKANIGWNFTEVATCHTPGITPSAGIMFFCGDTNHHLYSVDSTGAVLQLGGGSGFTKSWIRATRSTGQVIADNTPTSLVWDTNDAHNTGALFTHSTSSNTERIVAASSTYAHGGCQVSASTGASGNVWKVSVSQVVSGTPVDISQSDTAYSNELQTNISFSTYILAGDYLVCNVYQNTGLTAPLTGVANFVVEN